MTNETPTPQDHHEPKPTTVIELGKWFNPFIGYNPDPTKIGKAGLGFIFNIKENEFYEPMLLHMSQKEEDHSESEVRDSLPTIASPLGEKMISHDQLNTEEAKMETPLVRFSSAWHGFPPDVDIPYRIKMRLPDGTEINFYETPRDNNGKLTKPFSSVYFPNTQYALEKVQIMIAPREVTN